MRPVNLLPAGDRARAPIAVSENAHKVVLGVLAGLLVAVLAYVLTTNQITTRKADIDKANQEQQAAQARVDKLGPFGRFAQIKTTRVKSVSDLAKTRFDWERLMRELALVLPDGVWLTEVDASATGTPESGAGSSSPAAADTATGAGTSPSVLISGCAKSQSTVATAMVRMRSLHRAENVDLTESGNNKADGGGSGGGGEPNAGGEGCGKRYAFKTTVTFSAEPTAGTTSTKRDGVPASLGGGS